ncbi:MAG: FliI/YscN family ATPase [Bdellovibrionota bacterium]|nr:FliI/YscN family ATPase [Bdellovibrionota bacterium]
MSIAINFEKYERIAKSTRVLKESGKVTRVIGYLVEGYLPGASIGSIADLALSNGDKVEAEVIGLTDQKVLLMPFRDVQGIRLGSSIVLKRSVANVQVGDGLLGRVIDATGTPIDGKGPIVTTDEFPIYESFTNPLERPPIDEALQLGVRALDGTITVGKGQRVGIMAGSGVGKSVLLGMMAKNTTADINVIALIGERGREVKEFIENVLGEEGLKRSIVVCVTGDQNALLRKRGAFLATAISEYFAKQGNDVLLTMDSVTRFAMAQREIGLSAGEPPATKGYTPSVFALLPKLLERVGRFANGSVTGLYTVLVEQDDMDDPIGDAVRSIVDGHIVLDRKLAAKAHFPAIDVLQSASRVMNNIVDAQHMKNAMRLKEMLATYREAEDLINIGAYQQGTNPQIDQAINLYPSIIQFLKQGMGESTDFEHSVQILDSIVG